MNLSEGFSDSKDFYYEASGGARVSPSNVRTTQPPAQRYRTSESVMDQDSVFRFPSMSQHGFPDDYNWHIEEPSADVGADVVQNSASPSRSWFFNAAFEPPPIPSQPDYNVATQYSLSQELTPVTQMDPVWGNRFGPWDVPNSSFVPHDTPESFDSSLQLQGYCNSTSAFSGIQNAGLLYPDFQRDMAPTHSRNSSFSQSSVGSGPSSGWVTDELSDGFSAPSTPFFTPGSTYSELQSDRSPSSMSSVLPSRLSPSQRKQARDVKAAAKYLAELEKSHKQAALPKLPKERTEKNQEASEARRSNKSTIVACPVPECGETYTRLTGLKDHLAKHFPMRRRTTLQCPYTGCSYKTDTKSSMTRHQNLKRHFKSITPEV